VSVFSFCLLSLCVYLCVTLSLLLSVFCVFSVSVSLLWLGGGTASSSGHTHGAAEWKHLNEQGLVKGSPDTCFL
jgi:hypothetical protein